MTKRENNSFWTNPKIVLSARVRREIEWQILEYEGRKLLPTHVRREVEQLRTLLENTEERR